MMTKRLFVNSPLFCLLALAILPGWVVSEKFNPEVNKLSKDTNGCVRLAEGQYAFVPFGPESERKFLFGTDSTEEGASIIAIPENSNAPRNVPQEFVRIPGSQRGIAPTTALWDIKLSTTRSFTTTGNHLNLYTVINRATGLVLSAGSGERSLTQERLDSTGSERNDDWCFRFREGQPGVDRKLSYVKPKGPYSVSIEVFSTGKAIRYLRDANRRRGDDMIITGFGSGRNALFSPRFIGQGLPFPRPTSAPSPAPTTCNSEGATCGVGNVCCRGFTCQTTSDGGRQCIANRAPSPPSCGAEGTSCAGDQTCCGPLVCQNTGNNNLVCLFPPTGPNPSVPTTPVPPTAPTAPTIPTPPTGGICQARGRACGNGVTCCSGLTCQGTNFGNLCRPSGIFPPPTFPTAPSPLPPTAICQTRGRVCGSGVSCCGGLSCQNTIFGSPRCRPVSAVCRPRGRPCGNSVACCSGLSCRQTTRFGIGVCRSRSVFPPPRFPTPTPPAPSPSNFNTLLFLVGPSCADIASELVGATVFGPTDLAFATYFSSTGLTTNVLCSSDIDTLSSILTYHVIPGSITGADIRELIPNIVEFQSLFGEPLNVNTVNLDVNGVKISIPDARSTPFVLHGIDGVLIPPNSPGIPIPPPKRCLTRGRRCENGECCDGLKCQRTNFGKLCRPPTH